MTTLTTKQDTALNDICSELLDVDQMDWDTRLSETQSMFSSLFSVELSLDYVKQYYYNIRHGA